MICHQMGFEFGMYLFGASGTIDDYAGAYVEYGNVQCDGDEETIWHCDMDANIAATQPDCDMVQSAVFLYCVRFS